MTNTTHKTTQTNGTAPDVAALVRAKRPMAAVRADTLAVYPDGSRDVLFARGVIRRVGAGESVARLTVQEYARRKIEAGAPTCQFCTRPDAIAMPGQRWCRACRPGPRPRRPVPGSAARLPVRTGMPDSPRAIGNLEGSALRTLPVEILSWPPVQRLMADPTRRPYQRNPGLRHVAIALAREALGDALAWPDLVALLTARGFVAPTDPPRPRCVTGAWDATGWQCVGQAPDQVHQVHQADQADQVHQEPEQEDGIW